MPAPENTPVIIGVGEILDRPSDPAASLEPAALMAEALRRADADSGGSGALTRIDSIDIVNQMGWRYADIAAVVCSMAGIAPGRAAHGPVGGETPLRLLNDAALRIARGEGACAAVVGGEAQYAIDKAKAANINLPWTPLGPKRDLSHLINFIHPIALKHLKFGGMVPAQIYPFYETAASAAWGQTPAEALAESGVIWEGMARVASSRPVSWLHTTHSAAEIITASPGNRMVVWPYTKRMVANPAVNIGGAVIVASLAEARRLGVAEEKLLFVWGGAAANEPRDYLARDQYQRSDAQNVVLEAAQGMAGGDGFAAIELYSCFPIVPKMARRTLALGAEAPMTVCGGLSFFGAPVNSYMTNATVAMTQALRAGCDARPGLLYGQGEFVTKHHALLIGRAPPPRDVPSPGYDRQGQADARRALPPPILEEYEGLARIETCTAYFGRDGAAEFATVIARTPEGSRLMARVPREDRDGLEVVTSHNVSPVGREGLVRVGSHGLLHWNPKGS